VSRVVQPVPVASVRVERWPSRKSVASLVEYLAAGGSVPAIKLQKQPGEFRILDGRHRLLAHKLLGRPWILARWFEAEHGAA
jgi:ParB-like chromosome segregation protein Spo0J